MNSQFVKRVLLLVNLFAILFLLLGLLAGHVPPHKLRFLILFGLSFPLFAIINFLFIWFWIFLKKYYFIFPLLTLLISYQTLNASFNLVGAKKIKKAETTFSVLSHNVKVFDLYNWSHNKKTRNEYFKYLRKLAPEIACFQEYFNSSDHYFPIHDSLIRNQKFKYSHIYYSVKLKNGNNFGIATYSRYPIIKKKNLSFGDTHNLAIVSDIVIKRDTVRIINCHLQSVRFHKEDYHFLDNLTEITDDEGLKGAKGVFRRLIGAAVVRGKQTELIVKEIKKSPYPVILCGDFNDVPSSYTVHQFSELMNDSFHKQGLGINGTFPRFLFPFRIDYILYENSVNCHQFQTLKTKLSDHYAIIGKYSVGN